MYNTGLISSSSGDLKKVYVALNNSAPIERSNVDINMAFSYKSSSAFDTVVGTSSPQIASTTGDNGRHLKAQIKLNADRRAAYIVNLLNKEEFNEGVISTTEVYLSALYKEDPVLFGESFQKAWLKLYELDDSSILANFICIVSALNYEWLNDKADTLILGGCCHVDPYVNEATLRAIEAWEIPKHSCFLNQIREFEIEWLEEYRLEVIEIFKGLK